MFVAPALYSVDSVQHWRKVQPSADMVGKNDHWLLGCPFLVQGEVVREGATKGAPSSYRIGRSIQRRTLVAPSLYTSFSPQRRRDGGLVIAYLLITEQAAMWSIGGRPFLV
jgi:hypothetical protein